MVYFFTNFFREECAIQPEVWADPLRDVQRVPPRGWCPRCRSELYSGERGLCPAYRASAAALRERVLLLEHRLRGADGDGRRLLEGRIRLLRAMGREARELAVLCERYYERGYCRNGKYTL